ncbi:MAG: hypothetical protein IH623_24355 [Verrucomicrobia bacterium]|nr:hypothetical protein [Verrucomicrobiota bacterium]
MLIVFVIIPVLMIIVVVCRMCAGSRTVAMMQLRQEMNPDVIDVERKKSRRQHANPPPTRSRAGWQSALLA